MNKGKNFVSGQNLLEQSLLNACTTCELLTAQDDIHTAYEKLYKLSKKHEKLYRLTTKKLSDVELDREELSTKFDEANQTIGALRFENNFLV